MLEIKQLTRLQIIRYCEKLEEEIKTLKDKIEFLTNCLDDRDKSIELLKEEKKTLKESLDIATKCSSKEENGIIRLSEENKNLKSELSKFRDSFKKYRDYEKEELAESCYDFARENDKLKEENRNLGKENFVMKDRLKFGYKGVTREEIERVEEENRKLKERIEELEKEIEELNKMMLFETELEK